jgi:hypothetical protein
MKHLQAEFFGDCRLAALKRNHRATTGMLVLGLIRY